MTTKRIKQISNGLNKYYKSQGWEYNDGFITYCNDNAIDDDALDDEFAEENPTETVIIDYFRDPNNSDTYIFPFPSSNQPSSKLEQAKFIMKIIKECEQQKFC